MTFKKTTMFAMALLVSVAVFGQKSKRTSANNYLEWGELDNAKEAIDPCITHEKTMNEAKTWFFRGQIYQKLYETKDEKYKTLHDNPLQVALESFLKCIELDVKKYHTDLTLQYVDIEGKQFVNEGILAYNAKDYSKALKAFQNTLMVCEIEPIKRIDTLAIYYAGACAEQTGDLELSEKYFRQAIALNYKAETAFVRMERMYAAAGNEDKAFALLKEGREKYPNNQTMVTDEVNVYLKADKHAEAMEALKVAIAGDPTNASLHFAFGFVNDRLAAKEIEANPKGGETYMGFIAAAEKSYAKSVELDGENFDAVYNLGALYFNRAVKMNEAANMIDDMKKFEVARNAADAVFDQALPILEKAYEITPDDKGVLVSLKQLYYRKMAKDESYKTKYDEVLARMKGEKPTNSAIKANPSQPSSGNYTKSEDGTITIPMTKESGIYTVPCKINGLDFSFFYDSGASNVVIGLDVLSVMIRQDKISESDFLGTSYSKYANGEYGENILINIKELEVGGKVLKNIQASASGDIDTPMLLGQSVLGQFSSVTQDKENMVLILKK